jgi:hypothetical protein
MFINKSILFIYIFICKYMGLTRILGVIHLDLAARQVQGGVGLICMLTQDVWTWQLVKFKIIVILPWHFQESDRPLLSLISGKNSVYIGLTTLDILNSIFSITF